MAGKFMISSGLLFGVLLRPPFLLTAEVQQVGAR